MSIPNFLKIPAALVVFIVALSRILPGGNISSAVEMVQLDQDIQDKYPAAAAAPIAVDRARRKAVRSVDQLDIYTTFYVLQGYTDNANLDPSRDKDGFLQALQAIDYSYGLTDTVKVKGGVEFFETIFYTYNDNNIFNIVPYMGFDWAIFPWLEYRGKIMLDYLSYPNYNESSFTGLELVNYLRHYVTGSFYHEAGYTRTWRWYPDQEIYMSDFVKTDTDRDDGRDSLNYNLGLRIGKRCHVRLRNEWYWNDSNDEYQDYYDYWAYRLKPSIIYFFTDKFYTDIGMRYMYRSYDDRRSTENIYEKVRENNLNYNASLFYDLTKNVTLGATYSYTENYPNDPFYKYSESMITGGVYLTF